MSFLKKFGQIALQGAQIALGFAPFVSQTLPQSTGLVGTVSKDITQIAAVIGEVETAGQALQLPGAQKLIAASPLVAQVLLQSSLLAGKKIANEALFQQGAKKIADGMADVLNSIHEDSLKTLSPQDAKPPQGEN